MTNRSGERLGWIGGWSGGFIWVLILAITQLVRGKTLDGAIGLGLFVVAIVVILASAPWRHPRTPFRWLMLPVYALLFVCLGWTAWSFGGLEEIGLGAGSVFLLLPILIPLFVAGGRRWVDGGR